jgi:hypothetical protein
MTQVKMELIEADLYPDDGAGRVRIKAWLPKDVRVGKYAMVTFVDREEWERV